MGLILSRGDRKRTERRDPEGGEMESRKTNLTQREEIISIFPVKPMTNLSTNYAVSQQYCPFEREVGTESTGL